MPKVKSSRVELTSPYVFISRERLAHIRAKMAAGKWNPRQRMVNNVNRVFGLMKRAAQVDKGCVHDLRASAIMNWLERGVPPHEVQQWSGHADLSTVQHYVGRVDRTAMERVREASEAIAAELAI